MQQIWEMFWESGLSDIICISLFNHWSIWKITIKALMSISLTVSFSVQQTVKKTSTERLETTKIFPLQKRKLLLSLSMTNVWNQPSIKWVKRFHSNNKPSHIQYVLTNVTLIVYIHSSRYSLCQPRTNVIFRSGKIEVAKGRVANRRCGPDTKSSGVERSFEGSVLSPSNPNEGRSRE